MAMTPERRALYERGLEVCDERHIEPIPSTVACLLIGEQADALAQAEARVTALETIRSAAYAVDIRYHALRDAGEAIPEPISDALYQLCQALWDMEDAFGYHAKPAALDGQQDGVE